jgi:hypothetical protein
MRIRSWRPRGFRDLNVDVVVWEQQLLGESAGLDLRRVGDAVDVVEV